MVIVREAETVVETVLSGEGREEGVCELECSTRRREKEEAGGGTNWLGWRTLRIERRPVARRYEEGETVSSRARVRGDGGGGGRSRPV